MTVEGEITSVQKGLMVDKEDWKWIHLARIGLAQVGMGQLSEAVQ